MKRKISKIFGVGLALVLVLSLSLVMAAPVAAEVESTYAGYTLGADVGSSATWDDAQKDTGIYSVKLVVTSNEQARVEFTPTPGITVNDLAAITDGWSWWYHASGPNGPLLELRFVSADNVDPDGAGHVDITVNTAELSPATSTGTTEEVTSASTCIYFGNDPTDGTAFFDNAGSVTLAGVLAAINAEPEMTAPDVDDDATNWELTRVRMELWPGAVRTCYIDDIEINGTTYELEPIFLDKEAYNVGATVEVTVPNFAANTDSIRINPVTGEPDPDNPVNSWSVSVISDSDSSGITVDLQETGVSTGIFTGSFTTVDTPPAEDELYVEEGDDITVTYDTTGTSVGWGTNADEITSISASVDDTTPTITEVFPEGTTDNRTPEIGAEYDNVPTDSVELIFDGEDVTDDDATTVTATSVTYTPEDELDDGTYDVTVNIEDAAGNPATRSWSFSVASWAEGSPVEDLTPADGSLDELDTVGVAVSGATSATEITVGRYASNPQPEATPAFAMIENGFFDVKVTGGTATLIVIKFADPEITAESTAYVWGETEGEWLECSDQGYNSVADPEYLWVKVRSTTTPSIVELDGTPFAISGEPAVEDILAYYKGLTGDAGVVDTADLLMAANDWADAVVPPGFTEAISTTQLLALANEWAATE